MDDNGNTREDLMLPKGTDEADKLAETIKDYHRDGKEMSVTVLKVVDCDFFAMMVSQMEFAHCVIPGWICWSHGVAHCCSIGCSFF